MARPPTATTPNSPIVMAPTRDAATAACGATEGGTTTGTGRGRCNMRGSEKRNAAARRVNDHDHSERHNRRGRGGLSQRTRGIGMGAITFWFAGGSTCEGPTVLPVCGGRAEHPLNNQPNTAGVDGGCRQRCLITRPVTSRMLSVFRRFSRHATVALICTAALGAVAIEPPPVFFLSTRGEFGRGMGSSARCSWRGLILKFLRSASNAARAEITSPG